MAVEHSQEHANQHAHDHSRFELDGIPCLWMRGGTSKGAMFLAEDLPADPQERDDLLLRIMGTPDKRQIDGIGGATSLTSKVAVISRSQHPNADVDYLFLQVGVDQPTVSDTQNCGNILAAVGPFAVEKGLVSASDKASNDQATVRIRMVNSDSFATAQFGLNNGRPIYSGDTHFSGVPGTGAPITLDFADTAGSSTGALFPTGNLTDVINGVTATCVDNGMPVVVVLASDLGLDGTETPAQLRENSALLERVDALRKVAGEHMGLGDVSQNSVPKTVALSAARDGGDVRMQAFIPVQPHESIGIFAAISAITAMRTPGCVGGELAAALPTDSAGVTVEHPSGTLPVEVEISDDDAAASVGRSAIVSTARKLFDGRVFPRPAQPTQTQNNSENQKD